MSRDGDAEVEGVPDRLLGIKLALDGELDDQLIDLLRQAVDRYEDGGRDRRDARLLLEVIEVVKSRAGELPQLELLEAAVAGRLLNPWLPYGVWRKVAMLGFFVLGWLAFVTPYQWLFWSFLVCLSFSPRVVGMAAFWSGRWSARRARNPN